MSKNLALKVAGSIFVLVAMFHLLRLALKLQFIVGGREFPMFFSTIGLFASIILAIWMFLAAAKK